MSNSNRRGRVTPTASDGVDVGTANTTALDLDVDIVVSEFLGLELRTISLMAV